MINSIKSKGKPQSIKLPDRLVETLRQLLHDSDQYQFAIGDLITEAVYEYQDYMSRAQLLRELARNTGADTSTLRDRQCVAEFFSKKDREKYDVFSYSQFRALKHAGDKWREYAEMALADANIWSADRIRAEVDKDGNGHPAWFYWWRKLDIVVDKLIDNNAPDNIRDLALYIKARWLAIGGDDYESAKQQEIK